MPATEVVTRARERAEAARAGTIGEGEGPPEMVIPGRVVAVGDPQTSTERFFGALDAAELIGTDGWLRPDVRLVAMGDYFDYWVPDRAQAQVEGVRILAWLAAHARSHVTVLLGNHDVSRVMELVGIDDARFEAAHRRAKEVTALPWDARKEANAAFWKEFPEIAMPGYAARDYNAFTVEQRELVQRLLLARRFDLATVERTLDGTPALLTHAGVTRAQLLELGLGSEQRSTAAIAKALNARLEKAVQAVEAEWRAGKPTPLVLAPLHVAARRGQEGGGLLYHRPADPERPGADVQWENAAHAPRRFDPRDLPRGVLQIVGHTGHSKAFEEMPRWRDPEMPTPTKTEHRGGLRTLAVSGRSLDAIVTYRRGVHAGRADEAIVWMIDPEMHYVPSPDDVALLELGGV